MLGMAVASPAAAEELSEKSVRSIMEYAWAMLPQQFTQKDGKVIIVNKTKKEDVMVPLDVAREAIRVGRISAHAQVCNLAEDQALNHSSLMKREIDKKKWSDQQQLYINYLHLTTVMLLTGKIKVIETDAAEPGKESGKEVVVDEKKEPAQTCSEEQKAKVKELIAQYVKSGPPLPSQATGVGAAAAAAAAPAAAATEAKVDVKPAEKK